MDISTQIIRKKQLKGEIRFAPEPVPFVKELEKGGIHFNSYCDQYCTEAWKGHPLDQRTRKFSYYCLTQLLDGDAFFFDAPHEAIHYFQPGYGLLITPQTEQMYGGYEKHFVEDSICFSGPLADSLFRNGFLKHGMIYYGSERRLLPIIRLIREGSLASFFEAQSTLVKILLELHREQSAGTGSNPYPRIQKLIQEVRASRTLWSVDDMAEFANMSGNYLRRLFQEQTGMSPKHFLDQLWLNRAAELICATELPLLEVANRISPGDPYYFFRRFKKLTRHTPAEYRKLFSRI